MASLRESIVPASRVIPFPTADRLHEVAAELALAERTNRTLVHDNHQLRRENQQLRLVCRKHGISPDDYPEVIA